MLSPGVLEVFTGNMLTIAVVLAVVWFIFLMIDLVDWIDDKTQKPPAPPEAFIDCTKPPGEKVKKGREDA